MLADLRRAKRNRRVAEVERVLEACGFKRRLATKEGTVWQRGRHTLTLPRPHGGDPALHPRYVSLVVRVIDAAEGDAVDSEEPEDDP